MNKKNVTIITPTYNEESNISDVLKGLMNVSVGEHLNTWCINILVVDGNSSDETVSKVKKLQQYQSNIYLIQEKSKSGIGTAYVHGFQYAVNNLHSDVIIEMDGALQHPPETIVPMLHKIDQGYDYVLASRQIAGGSIPENWGFYREKMSKWGGWLARYILLYPSSSYKSITDITTGFKASRVNGFVDSIDLSSIHSKSFAYKLELLHSMVGLKAKTCEIPLSFQPRNSGKSKMTIITPFEILWIVVVLRLESFYHKKTNSTSVPMPGEIFDIN